MVRVSKAAASVLADMRSGYSLESRNAGQQASLSNLSLSRFKFVNLNVFKGLLNQGLIVEKSRYVCGEGVRFVAGERTEVTDYAIVYAVTNKDLANESS